MKQQYNKTRQTAGTIIRKITKPKSRPSFDAVAYAAALEVLG